MSIDPENFKPQGKPTMEQALEQYRTMRKPSSQKLCDRLVGLGYSISKPTCARWIALNFKEKKVFEPPQTPLEAITTEAHKLIGGNIEPAEMSLMEKDLTELRAKDVTELKAIFEKERLVTNIMLQRHTQRRADALVLLPKDSASLVVAMTDAQSALSTVPAAKLNEIGRNGEVIDVTPNPPNPVASAIENFQRKRLAG